MRPEGASAQLVLTLDVITPLVDEPRAFGRIAAANALSDVYAMGGRPQVALSFVGAPDALGLEVLRQILEGMSATCQDAAVAIVGGHTIRDSEPKAGLAVVGSVQAGQAWSHTRASAGQRLVLTKALGTGVLAQALRADAIDDMALTAAVESMCTLNARAAELGRVHRVTAATDVTGFGFLGHLGHILDASGVGAVVQTERVPLLPGALAAARAGHLPGGSKRNAAYVEHRLTGPPLETALRLLLADAQTSGGLLLCLSAEDADALVAELGPPAAVLGELTADAGRVELR